MGVVNIKQTLTAQSFITLHVVVGDKFNIVVLSQIFTF